MLKDCTKHRWNIFYYDLRAVVRYQQQLFNSLTINIESSVLWCPLQFPHWRQCSVRLYLPLFVGGLVSYLRYLCLFAQSDAKHILYCAFCFVFLRLVYQRLSVLCIVYFVLPLLYYLMFISNKLVNKRANGIWSFGCSFLVFSYHMSLRSEFRVVIYVTISANDVRFVFNPSCL